MNGTMAWHEDHEEVMLVFMVFLLMMLSIVIWVAFCVAVKKTARKFLELKRQRRREALISAAINRAANGDESSRRSALPLYIATLTQGLNLFDTNQELPSYEQALAMSTTPSPNPVSTSNDRVPPYKPRSPKPNRVQRVAPERPGALPTIVLPPSYESSVVEESPIYTISGSMSQTPI